MSYKIYDELADLFAERGYVWKTDKGLVVPDAKEIEAVVDRAVARLYSEPVGTILEVGRLIIHKSTKDLHDNDLYDIYLHIGEVE